MKIKLTLFLSDKVYAENLEIYFKKNYSDKVELYIFSNQASLKSGLIESRTNILLLDEGTSDAVSVAGEEIQVIFLVSSLTGNLPNEVLKYQKAENIYKTLLNIYADKKGSDSIYRDSFNDIPIYVFQSINGGAGATTIALAYARNLAMRQKKVFYLNLEEFESTYLYMDSDGAYSMETVLMALKKRSNLEMKIESAVRKSREGIYYFYPSYNPFDMKDITAEDIEILLGTLAASKHYDIIIVDQKLSADEKEIKVMNLSDKIFWISNGSEISICKYRRARTMILSADKKSDSEIFEKINIIYNAFSNKTGKEIADSPEVACGFPRYEKAGYEEIVNNLSKSELFNKLDG